MKIETAYETRIREEKEKQAIADGEAIAEGGGAPKEKSPEQIATERAVITEQAKVAYDAALQQEALLINEVEKKLAADLASLPEERKPRLKSLRDAILLATSKYKHWPALHGGAPGVSFEADKEVFALTN